MKKSVKVLFSFYQVLKAPVPAEHKRKAPNLPCFAWGKRKSPRFKPLFTPAEHERKYYSIFKPFEISNFAPKYDTDMATGGGITQGINMLYDTITQIIQDASASVYRTANFTMVKAYWHIRKAIVEEEQNGLVKL